MDQIKLFHENGRGTTVVSNLFIDRYMKDANDAQLKVYFYLLRSITNDTACSITDIADQFNHTEKDVIRSLKYWERAGLLSIDMADDSDIIGIHLLPIPEYAAPSLPLNIAPVPVMTIEQPFFNTVSKDTEDIMPVIPVKPKYTAKHINDFAQDEEGREIVCLAENYLNITISADNLKSLLYIHQELRFSCEMIDELLQYCAGKKLKRFSAIEKVAIGWYEQGSAKPAGNKPDVLQYDQNIQTIMRALGKNSNSPTAREIEYMNKWMHTFGFNMEIILYGCERAVLATDSNRFPYADGIFTKWNEQNVTTLDNVKALEASFRNEIKKKTTRKKTDTSFSQIQKHNYDFDKLEKDVLKN